MGYDLGLKRILTFSLIGLILSGFSPNNEIVAEDLYSYECGNDFEVSYITDDGKFKKDSCQPSFDAAKAEMEKKGPEYVVRHKASLSPTKIVSMLSGKAYSYPARNEGSSGTTISIWQDVNKMDIECKTTYVANHYELDYKRTERYFAKSGTGMAEVALNGFEGFTDLEFVDLVPDKFIDKGLAIYLGGGDVTSHNEQPFKVIVRRNYYEVVENDGINELKFVFHRSYCPPSSTNKFDEEHSIILGPASPEMTVGAKYYSSNGYEFYNNKDYSDEPITFYPYYQFLPLRTKTNLTAEQIDNAFLKIKGDINSKLKGNANIFIDSQNTYGVNALLLYSMAAHESGWGTSKLSLDRNNLFGWKAIDSDPGNASSFPSVSQGVYEQAGYNLRQYMDIFSPLYFSSSLGNKGSGFNVKYASDPYWGMKIAAIAYRIDKVANNNHIIDYDQYDLALVKTFDAQFKKTPNKDAETAYTAKYSDKYQENLIVVKLEDDDNFTKVQSTNPIKDGQVITTNNNKNLVPYSFDESVVYLNNVDIVSLNYEAIKLPDPMGEYIHQIDDVSWDGEALYVTGVAYTENVEVNEENSITNTLKLQHQQDIHEFTLESTANEDGSVKFAGSIKLDELPVGKYHFTIETTYGKRDDANNSFEIVDVKLPNTKIINNRKYAFEIKDHALVLDIQEIKEVKERKYMVIDELNLNAEGIWSLTGRAFLSGHNYDALENIKHELIVIDQTTEEIVKEYPLETIETPSFSLNDDYVYDFVGFKGNIPLSELPNGHYRFNVRVTLKEGESEVVSLINLESASLDYASNIVKLGTEKENERLLRLTTNQLYSARFELDVEDYVFDYGTVKKPSLRESFLSFDQFVFNENHLQFGGYGFIYYTNVGIANEPKYVVSLVDQNGNKFDLGASLPEEQMDYSKIFSKSRDLSRISFSVDYDLSQLQPGVYDLMVEMSTTDEDSYYDIVQMKDYQNNEYEIHQIGDLTYQFVVSKDRNRLQLVVAKTEVTSDLNQE